MADYLGANEYRELLLSALPASSDADTVDPQPRTLFTPGSHRTALDPDVTIVRGARGVGKTVWYKALQDEVLRALAADDYQIARLRTVRTLPGYGTELRPDAYPGPTSLSRLLQEGVDPYDIWMAVLLWALGTSGVRSESSWLERSRWVSSHPDEQEVALATADREASEKGITYLFLFDALDRLQTSRALANQLISGILRLSLDLRTRTRNLRAKVFIRPDMFDSLQLHFPDASKLAANATDLYWSITNLYGLLFQQLGNSDSPYAEHFRSSTGSWRSAEANRYSLPRNMEGDQAYQRKIFTQIAGPYMGSDHRKGHTYTWLPNHLMDGHGQTSPRSFLQALSTANIETMNNFATHRYALYWDGIRRGVQEASKIRVSEVTEDLPWVKVAMTPLSRLQVPVDQEAIVSRWLEDGLADKLHDSDSVTDESGVRTGPRNPDDYDQLIGELEDIGIITRRSTGRLDLPDVYRLAFGLGRKGGVPRIS